VKVWEEQAHTEALRDGGETLGWTEVPLARLGKVQTGSTPSTQNADFWDGDIPFVTPSDLDSTLPITKTPRTLSLEGSKVGRLLSAGSVLVCCIGSLGKTGLAGTSLVANQQINSIEFDAKKVFSKYGYYACRRLRTSLENMAPATTLAIVSKSKFEQLLIPLPPLPEQRRIAAILDQAEELRTLRKKALGLLDELTRSVFLEMFGAMESVDWPMTEIRRLADETRGAIRTGPFGSQLLHEEFTSSGVAVLGIDNAVANEFRWSERRYISEAKYQQLKRYRVYPGDVLITIMGTCGRCAIVPEKIPVAINTKHLCCITLDKKKVIPVFLHAYFLLHPIVSKYLGQQAKGAVMDGLNMGIIKGIPLPLPPLPLQQEFARRVAAIEALKATHKVALAKLDELFASLQHRAFRGEL